MLKTFIASFFICFSLFHSVIHAEPHSLIVNIISHSLENGAGKQVDVAIIKAELEKLGHQVRLFDYHKVDKITSADINIFLAQFKSNWFSKARLNWFVPNAESCEATLDDLKKFDCVLCKTEECLRIFRPLSKEAYYLGFTSIDHHHISPSKTKNFSKFLHLAGKSNMKGSGEVFRTWKSHSEFPQLVLIKHTQRSMKVPKNIKLMTKRISDQYLLSLQNECGIHLCPSKTEGFGHYIMEAMSTGAVVITTDAPPMNEFIRDKRCLVDYKLADKKKYATTYVIDEKKLAKTVKVLQQLSVEELQTIGELNRQEYLRRNVEFKQNFERLIHQAVRDLHG